MRELLVDAIAALWHVATEPLRRLIRAEIETVFAESFTGSIFPTGIGTDGLVGEPVALDDFAPLHLVDDDGSRP